MSDAVQYEKHERFATVTMDDGKVNCINLAMAAALNGALDRAEADQLPVVLRGRPGVFSAGFDLKAFQGSPDQVIALLRAGAELLHRMLSFPTPILVASTGHALAMGSFLTLAADQRIGVQGKFRYGMNEVAIGMTLPHFAIAVAQYRLPATHYDRAANTAEIYDPAGAVEAGFLDRVVPEADFESAVQAEAERLAGLNMDAYRGTKTRVREPVLRALRAGIESELSGPSAS